MIYLLVLLFPKDFEACTQALHRLGYSTPELTAASGTSAGGLIVGAVCNRSPGLFKAVILKVGYSLPYHMVWKERESGLRTHREYRNGNEGMWDSPAPILDPQIMLPVV